MGAGTDTEGTSSIGEDMEEAAGDALEGKGEVDMLVVVLFVISMVLLKPCARNF